MQSERAPQRPWNGERCCSPWQRTKTACSGGATDVVDDVEERAATAHRRGDASPLRGEDLRRENEAHQRGDDGRTHGLREGAKATAEFLSSPATGAEQVICPNRIYNFCLLHACFVLLCHVLLELHYTFEPIWTNLLTQCTQLPVPVFCCFCISGFPAIKSAPKIPEKLYKKSAQRKLPESPKQRRRANTRHPGGHVARPHPGPRQGPSWSPGGGPPPLLW